MGRARSQMILKDISPNTDKSKKSVDLPESPCISLKKWIDYSSKYGIGYTLSNGMIGVYFNDSTKILSHCDDQFYYIERIEREDITKKYGFR